MEKDLVEKRCLSDNRRYADLINGFVFQGRQILHEKDLEEMDTQTGLWGRKRFGRKSDRLCPCITLVLFFGEEWDGCRDLHGVLDFTDIPPELERMVNNYPLHLLEVRKLEQTDIFRTDLRQIFDIIRFSENKEKLRKVIESDPAYREMDEDAYDMAAEYVKAEELAAVKKFYKKEGKVDMCKALKELIEDGRREGREEGWEKGREEGEAKILVKSVESVMEKFHIDLEAACNGVGITVSEYRKAKARV